MKTKKANNEVDFKLGNFAFCFPTNTFSKLEMNENLL